MVLLFQWHYRKTASESLFRTPKGFIYFRPLRPLLLRSPHPRDIMKHFITSHYVRYLQHSDIKYIYFLIFRGNRPVATCYFFQYGRCWLLVEIFLDDPTYIFNNVIITNLPPWFTNHRDLKCSLLFIRTLVNKIDTNLIICFKFIC